MMNWIWKTFFIIKLYLKYLYSFWKHKKQTIYKNKIPIVLVHGFYDVLTNVPLLGLWNLLKSENEYNIIIPRISYWGSDHDRAVQLFYQIKGGRINYGKEHSIKYKHNQFGEYYSGAYSIWSKKNPIHIIGFSQGGSTIRELYLMMQNKCIPGYNNTEIEPQWFKSVSTIFGCNNGTSLISYLGYECDKGKFKSILFNFICWSFINIHIILHKYIKTLNKIFNIRLLAIINDILDPKMDYYTWSELFFKFNNILFTKDTAAHSTSIGVSLDRSLQVEYYNDITYVHVISSINTNRIKKPIPLHNFIGKRISENYVKKHLLLLPYEQTLDCNNLNKQNLYNTHKEYRWIKNDGLINRISQGIFGIYRENLNDKILKIDLREQNILTPGNIYIHHKGHYAHLDMSLLNYPSVVFDMYILHKSIFNALVANKPSSSETEFTL